MKKIIIFLILLGFYNLHSQPLSLISTQATSVSFNFTGGVQTFTVPVTLCVPHVTFVVRGAKGGGANGGLGAAVQATVPVTPGQVFQIYVGGMGTQGAASGGFNGGGNGQASSGSAGYASWGGGGASDVRTGAALATRIIVAGGGGGRGGGSTQVCGGNANCNNGANGCNTFGAGGQGGTQFAGGAGGTPWAATPPGGSAGTLGQGGQGGPWQTASGGGGGGGYYGGGGGGNDGCCTGANGGGGGGGGSSLVPAGSLCAGAAQNGNGNITVYYIPGIKTAVNESYAMCTRTAPNLNTFSLTAQVSHTAAPAVLTFSWTGPNGFNSIVNSTASVINPPITPTVGNYFTQTSPGPGTVISTYNLLTPNPSSLASGIYSVYAGTNGTVGACASTVQVMVKQTPTLSLFAVNAPTCQGSTLNFSLTPINPTVAAAGQSVIANYSWTGPNSFASNLQNPSIANSTSLNAGTYSGTAAYNYTQSLASTIYTTAPNTPSIINTVLSCKKDSSLLVVIINTVTPSSSTYTRCQGSSVTLTTTAFGATSYSWSGPAAYTSTLQNTTINNLMPTHAGNYTTTAFFTSSQTTLVCTSTAVSNLSVVATSPVAINLTPNVCQFSNTSLVATAPGAVGFSWTGPNNFTGNTATVTLNNIQPVSQGAYFATAGFVIGTVSCTTQGSAVQNVVPVNPVNVIPQISQCEPANIGLQANAASASTYSWAGPNTFTSNLSNPQLYNLYPNASGVYTVTVAFNNGNLTCYNSNTTNVTINPKLNFTLTPYTLTCFNSLLNINGPAGATTYSWIGSSGYTSNTQNLNIPFVQANQSGVYTLEVMLGPCKTTGSTIVDVLDPIKFDKTPSNKTICRGDAVTFSMQSVGGSGNYAYVWNPPLYVGSPTGSVQTGNPLGTTIYNVTGYDIACPHYTINHTFTLTVNQPPQPNLQLEKVNGCQPLCQLYNSKTQSEASSTIYDFGNGIKFQADSINYCIDVPGTYNLKIYSVGSNGCKGTYSYPLPITVYPKPGSSISHTPEYITLSDNQVVFNPIHQAGPVVTHNWMFLGTKESLNGAVDSSGIKNPERVFETAGKYPVMLVSTTDKGCVDTVVKFIEVNEDLSVYIPNTFTPNGDGVNDLFMVKGTGMKIDNFSMDVFDRWGTLLYSTKDISKGWDGSAKGAALPIGAYVYKIKVVGENSQGKKEYVGHVTLMK